MTERMAYIWREIETGDMLQVYPPGESAPAESAKKEHDNYEGGPVNELRLVFWEVCDDGS